ncbi:MAG TPA: hypothetical protein VLV88_15630 [Terriglobales bacterium]|nr:hypothetical protein [Terriglobales bacterium]HUL17428.1 hypothetical protein [Terriglobales bacterium]
MAKTRSHLVLLLLVVSPVPGQTGQQENSGSAAITPGILHGNVRCTKEPLQSYALYLPSAYSTARTWPILYVFDPGARGAVAAELMKDAAEREGYIIAASNNARNGPAQPEFDAANAVFKDTHQRLAIDGRRMYFAGFSGSARVAARIASLCKCAAGVFLNGAGFPRDSPPSRSATFPVFSAVGNADFNYSEVVQLQDKLAQEDYPHWLRTFEGPHQWAPAQVVEEAFAWFTLQAMKSGSTRRDDAFLAKQFNLELERANRLEQSGDLFAAWRELRQAGWTFHGIVANEPFTQRADALQEQKAVREGMKLEEREFEQQERLTEEISAGLAALQNSHDDSTVQLIQVRGQIVSLRKETEHEKHPERLLVLKRALAGVSMQALEAGGEELEGKDIAGAATYFELATEGDPQSASAFLGLAIARAYGGDSHGALAALHKARELTKDPAALAARAKGEPAFAKLRDRPDFLAIFEDSAAKPSEAPHAP